MATDRSHPGRVGFTPGGDGLPAAVIEDLLACPRRRAMLRALVDADEPIAVGDLAANLAAGDTTASVSAADQRRARTEVFQAVLPKLTATGVVTFDSRLGTVAFAGPDALAARLDALAEE